MCIKYLVGSLGGCHKSRLEAKVNVDAVVTSSQFSKGGMAHVKTNLKRQLLSELELLTVSMWVILNFFLDEASLVYVATSGICSNPGKVVDSSGRSLLHLAASVGKRLLLKISR